MVQKLVKTFFFSFFATSIVQKTTSNCVMRERSGRDARSVEHLIGTAAVVMGSRAVRCLQDSARWVPGALQAKIFTPWSPRPNHPGRPCLQSPPYEELIAVGTLQQYTETPTTV